VFEALLKKVSIELNKNKIPYMIIGGQAVLLYGEPRFTRDIDITLGVDVDSFQDILSITEKLGLKPAADDPEKFAAKTNVFPVIDGKSGIRIDFIFSFSAYEREALKRAKHVAVSGVKVKYISAEDLIIHKLIAGRPRDIEDVKNVLARKKRLDIKYIRKWLRSFDDSLSMKHMDRFEGILKWIKRDLL